MSSTGIPVPAATSPVLESGQNRALFGLLSNATENYGATNLSEFLAKFRDENVEDYVTRESKIISNMMEDDCANNVIPVPKVMASILSKMIEWCKKHAQMKEDNNNSNNEEKEKELRSWDKEFVDLDTDILYHLLVAANYLGI
ncbi:SKP1-like protein 1A [Cinnamomum micranthum f. kanehirae]|uniref:SKP1-like protein 1A n=1 Tax=Cinnamomum micranthum f. kanehirae TaxID=337451 RepID=A0A3S3MTL4_9MAGN|nr:SKP1-like protein 1A [Cinnamomum micranthum f. kanehirae]